MNLLSPELQPPQSSGLLLHCGAQAVEPQAVVRSWTPRGTSTWNPIPHACLIELVGQALASAGLEVRSVAHSLSHEDQRYFGLAEITNREGPREYSWVLGMRNSHDKTFPAGLVAGAKIFVCDNLSFSGEVRIARKHTVNIMRDLPHLTGRAIGQLMERWHHQDRRIEAYQAKRIRDARAHDLVIRSVDLGALPNRAIPKVLQEWRNPRHAEFEAPTTWRLFNAFTEVLKGNLTELPKRTQALHALFDAEVGLARPGLN